MSKSNATETAILELVFTAVAPAWDGATQLDLHLHTADPGEAGTSATTSLAATVPLARQQPPTAVLPGASGACCAISGQPGPSTPPITEPDTRRRPGSVWRA